MSNSSKKGFLIEIAESYEFDDSSFKPGERDTSWSKIGTYFLEAKDRKAAEKLIERHLPEPKEKYRLIVKEAEIGIKGIYKVD